MSMSTYTWANLSEVVILSRKGQLQTQGVQGELQYLLYAVVVLGLDQLQVVIAYWQAEDVLVEGPVYMWVVYMCICMSEGVYM